MKLKYVIFYVELVSTFSEIACSLQRLVLKNVHVYIIYDLKVDNINLMMYSIKSAMHMKLNFAIFRHMNMIGIFMYLFCTKHAKAYDFHISSELFCVFRQTLW